MVSGTIIASALSKLFSAPFFCTFLHLVVKKLTLDNHWSDHYSLYNFSNFT